MLPDVFFKQAVDFAR